MKLPVVQTQNILSIREDTLSCYAEKPKFTKDAVMTEYSDAPTVMPPRRVPVALKDKLKNELRAK